MIQTKQDSEKRLQQGDILSDVEYIEYADENHGEITISKICFPTVIVLTQDCDLHWDYENRQKKEKANQDKYLFSVIVAPLYNYEHFIRGEHLSELKQTMISINTNQEKTKVSNLKNNEIPRYHYMEFEQQVPIVNSVIDFKHYFSVSAEHLSQHKNKHYLCTVSELFREQISQRFAYYLSRIGLPT